MADEREELMALRRLAELEAKAGGAQPQAAAPVPERVQRGGFGAQVGRAMSGQTPLTNTPEQQAQNSATAQRFGDIAKGGAIGVASGLPGLPGDVESLGRWALSPAGVSRDPSFPTSEEVGNYVFGAPNSPVEERSRLAGGLFSPMPWAKTAKAVDNIGGAIAQHSVGVTTGAGAQSVKTAYQAGKDGGSAADAFLNHMRSGSAVSGEAVQLAKDAVAQLRTERGAAYRAGIAATKANPQPLAFSAIDNALRDAASVSVYEGKSISTGAEKAWQDVSNAVDDWRVGDPAKFHTAEGLDALKQRIGNIAKDQNIQPHTPAAVVIDKVYDAVKATIVKGDPTYAKTMKDYMEASDHLREVERTLSLGKNATTDSSLRKLQSILRNNANTNYGARAELGEDLAARSPDLMPTLAGQAMNDWAPRGIQRALAGAGGVGVIGGAIDPTVLAAMTLASPRLVGEAAFAVGNARRAGGNLANTVKNAVIPGGQARIPGSGTPLDPRLLTMMSPQMLAALLAQTPARE